jgi:predicted TIM-barrel fold metal-dependent hydrolase
MKLARVVDAHVHLWELNHIRYPWLTPPFCEDGPNGSVKKIATPYLLENYHTDAQDFSVQKIVHVEAGAHPEDALKETQWLQTMADTTGFPHAIVAHAPLNNNNVEALLEAHSHSKNLRGIRHIINWHSNPNLTYTPKNLLDDSAFQYGYQLLNKFGLSFDLQIYPNQMHQAYELAKANPQVPVIINHMGMPVDRNKEEWQQGMKLLSSLPHVSVKISGFGFIDRQWNNASMGDLILQTVDKFGTDRVMFASDFPTDKLFNSFAQAFHTYTQTTLALSESEQDALFAANAERIYRI